MRFLNEKLTIEICEVRAALRTFKSLYETASDQAKKFKVALQAFHYEQESYQSCVKELQSLDDNKLLVGKLYH